jgi:hypothetical protein
VVFQAVVEDEAKGRAGIMMLRFQDYRSVFLGVSLISVLLATSPVLSVVVSLTNGSERFSELWLLGPDHMAENYPFNVHVGEQYSVYLGLGNHMGESKYYAVYVKFRNQTQPLPNATLSTPSALLALNELRAFVSDGGTWEKLVTFSFLDVSRFGNSSFVNRLVIDDRVVWVNSSAIWDSENKGFYYQLFFELWLYNATIQGFEFHNRFVGIWLNMTG